MALDVVISFIHGLPDPIQIRMFTTGAPRRTVISRKRETTRYQQCDTNHTTIDRFCHATFPLKRRMQDKGQVGGVEERNCQRAVRVDQCDEPLYGLDMVRG